MKNCFYFQKPLPNSRMLLIFWFVVLILSYWKRNWAEERWSHPVRNQIWEESTNNHPRPHARPQAKFQENYKLNARSVSFMEILLKTWRYLTFIVYKIMVIVFYGI